MNSELLAGKVAVITGGASGIGKATAELFVEQGAKVVIADLNADAGEQLASELGSCAKFIQTDVSNAEQVEAMVNLAVSHFGGLHVMFNNAGMSGAIHQFLDDPFEDFQKVMGVNLYGVMLGSQLAARHMSKSGGGSIINTTSIAALNPGALLMNYRTSKAAVIHFTKCIALDLAQFAIRVNCIAPGHIPAGMTFYDMSERIRQHQPLQRQGMPRDVANTALFLASDMSLQITGHLIPVDGGTNIGKPINSYPTE